MSDLQEQIEAAKARDARFRFLDLGLEVEAGLRQGNALHALMATLRQDGADAMRDFAYADLGNFDAVKSLQARAFRFQFVFDTLNGFLTRGQDAAHSLREDDMGRVED